jgi:hypothetical protein
VFCRHSFELALSLKRHLAALWCRQGILRATPYPVPREGEGLPGLLVEERRHGDVLTNLLGGEIERANLGGQR